MGNWIIKYLIFAFFLIFTNNTLIAAAPVCPKVDTTKKDPDGIAYCPSKVVEENAFAGVLHCAMKQATSWHKPQPVEIEQTKQIIKSFKDHNYKAMLAAADKVDLQVCRVVNGDDKYLVFFTKYGVTDYNGPHMMLRDAAKVSNVTIVSPHVLTDNNHLQVLAFQKSFARIYVQNGHHKGIGAKAGKFIRVTQPDGTVKIVITEPAVSGRISDFSHTANNVGHHAVKQLNESFPNQLFLHIHGMSARDFVMRSPSKNQGSLIAQAFDKAITDNTNIKVFKPFSAYYTMKAVSTKVPSLYLQTEVPVRIWLQNPMIGAKIVGEFEKLAIAWPAVIPTPTPSIDPTPTVEPEPEVDNDTEGCEGAEDQEENDIENPPNPDEPAEEPADTEVLDGEPDTVDEEVVVAPSPTPSPTPVIKWSPRVFPNVDTQDLICVAIKYTSGPSADVGRCLQTAQNVADFYLRMSNGKKKLIAKAIEWPFNGPANHENSGKVSDLVRAKYPSALFIVPNMFAKGSSHAGVRVAVLNNASYSNAAHEVGHLLRFGHSGAWKIVNGKEVYDQYLGSGSIMSRFFGGAFLAPNQFINAGFYSKEQYAVKTTTAAQTYELRPLGQTKNLGLKAIAVAPALLGIERPVFIALPPNCRNTDNLQCVAVYLGNAGPSNKTWESSSRVAMFGGGKIGGEYSDPKTGKLRIKVVGRAGEKRVVVQVSVDP